MARSAQETRRKLLSALNLDGRHGKLAEKVDKNAVIEDIKNDDKK